jgi:hypothetical protein
MVDLIGNRLGMCGFCSGSQRHPNKQSKNKGATGAPWHLVAVTVAVSQEAWWQ